MQNNFDLKKFLIENKLTTASQMLNEDILEDYESTKSKYKNTDKLS